MRFKKLHLKSFYSAFITPLSQFFSAYFKICLFCYITSFTKKFSRVALL
nr:MAG TPA: hypothetical protein [Caudoviricetes sp.]